MAKTCAICGGWGVVIAYQEVPPSTAEARMAARARHIRGDVMRMVEIACPRCAGWGTVPDQADNWKPIPQGVVR